MGKHIINLIAAHKQQKIITKSPWVPLFLLTSSHQFSNRNLHPHEEDSARKDITWRAGDGRGWRLGLRGWGGGCTRERELGGGDGGQTRSRVNSRPRRTSLTKILLFYWRMLPNNSKPQKSTTRKRSKKQERINSNFSSLQTGYHSCLFMVLKLCTGSPDLISPCVNDALI
jgi:hypothetical protein